MKLLTLITLSLLLFSSGIIVGKNYFKDQELLKNEVTESTDLLKMKEELKGDLEKIEIEKLNIQQDLEEAKFIYQKTFKLFLIWLSQYIDSKQVQKIESIANTFHNDSTTVMDKQKETSSDINSIQIEPNNSKYSTEQTDSRDIVQKDYRDSKDKLPEEKNKNQLKISSDGKVKNPSRYYKKGVPIVGSNPLLDKIQGNWIGQAKLKNSGEWTIILNLNLVLTGKIYKGKFNFEIWDPNKGRIGKYDSNGTNDKLQQNPNDPTAVLIDGAPEYFMRLEFIERNNELKGTLYKYKQNKKEYTFHGDVILKRNL